MSLLLNRYFLKILQVVYIVVYVACTFYITTKVLYFVICCLLWPIFPFLIFCGNFIDVKFSSEFFVFEKQFGGFMINPPPIASEDRYRRSSNVLIAWGHTREIGNFPRNLCLNRQNYYSVNWNGLKNPNFKDYTRSSVSWNFQKKFRVHLRQTFKITLVLRLSNCSRLNSFHTYYWHVSYKCWRRRGSLSWKRSSVYGNRWTGAAVWIK